MDTMKLFQSILVIGFILIILSPSGTLGAKTRLGTVEINYDLVFYKEVNGTSFAIGEGGREIHKVTTNEEIHFWIDNIILGTDEDLEQYKLIFYVTNSSGNLVAQANLGTIIEESEEDVVSSGYGIEVGKMPLGNYTFTALITDGEESLNLSKKLIVIYSHLDDVLSLDSDEDFIGDSIDECPNTPGILDNMGCPPLTTTTTTTTTTSSTTTTTTTTLQPDTSLDSGLLDRIVKGITNVTCRIFGWWC